MSHPTDLERLLRPIQPMPDFVLVALQKHGLEVSYAERPAYQRNDYLSWINRAVREATKQNRLNQMLDELANGSVYMGMAWNPK